MVFAQQMPSFANRDTDPMGLYFADRIGGNWLKVARISAPIGKSRVTEHLIMSIRFQKWLNTKFQH
jgi:hypothetical protein